MQSGQEEVGFLYILTVCAACELLRHMLYRVLLTVMVFPGSVSACVCAENFSGVRIVSLVSVAFAGSGADSCVTLSCIWAGAGAGGVLGGARKDSYRSHTAIDSTIATKTRLSVFMLFSFVPVRLHGSWLHTRNLRVRNYC